VEGLATASVRSGAIDLSQGEGVTRLFIGRARQSFQQQNRIGSITLIRLNKSAKARARIRDDRRPGLR
jgi:hypothetical protein